MLFHERLNHFDPYVPPCPFREDLYQRALNKEFKIGYFESLETSPVTAAMKRSFNIAKSALEQQGFQLVEIKLPTEDIIEARDVFIGLVVNYMLGPLINQLEKNYEEPLPCYKLSVMFYKTNFIFRNLLLSLLRLTGNQRIYDSAKHIRPFSQDYLHKLLHR